MANKKKNTRSGSAALSQPAGQPIEAKSIRTPRRTIEDDDFSPDYTPIIRDLKRIGMLAGAFFVILVALSFIL